MRSNEPTGPVLFVLAHPDDEFGVFPWIEQALRDGRQAVCVWMTDGGWGGQDVLCRQQESQAVLARMGVPLGSMHFLGSVHGIADGDLWNQLVPALQALRAQCAAAPPSELVIPAWEGGHPDHDASHLVGLALAREVGAAARQYTLYQGENLPGPMFKVLSPLAANGPCVPVAVTIRQRLRYILACTRYRSQWKSFVGLLPFYAMKLCLRRHPFVLQPVRLERTSERPHPGPLLYERRGGPHWDAFAARTAEFRHP